MLDTGKPSQDDNIVRRWHVVFVFGRWLAETFGVVVTFLGRRAGMGRSVVGLVGLLVCNLQSACLLGGLREISGPDQ